MFFPPLSFTRLRPAQVTGTLEGVYAWIAANYAAGKLHGGGVGRVGGRGGGGWADGRLSSADYDPLDTIGVLEMGGASLQATFVAGGAVPEEFRFSLELVGRTYTLYTHSFLVR